MPYQYTRRRVTRAAIVPVGPSIAYIELTQGMYALIDTEDVSRLSCFNWSARRHRGAWIAVRYVREGNLEKCLSMQEFLSPPLPDGTKCVHLSQSRLDNRSCNRLYANRQKRNTRTRLVYYPIGPSIAYVPLTKGKVSLICREDGPLLEKYNWTASAEPEGAFYAKRLLIEKGIKTSISMHRFLFPNLPAGIEIDHRSGDTLNNHRPLNLRPATRTENASNVKMRSTNRSGIKGVSFTANTRRWRAGITVNKRRIHLGYFGSKEEAAGVYNSAAEKHFGAFKRGV